MKTDKQAQGLRVSGEKLPPHLKPEYTVLPVGDQPTEFYVAGAIHGDEQCWYQATLGSGKEPDRCECKGFQFRGTCAHLKAVRAFVQRGLAAEADAAVQWYRSLSEEARKEIWR